MIQNNTSIKCNTLRVYAVYISKICRRFSILDRKNFIHMKRTLKLIAAIVLMAMLVSACNHYVCPAYTKDTAKEQSEAEGS
jgi:hypothetical protein